MSVSTRTTEKVRVENRRVKYRILGDFLLERPRDIHHDNTADNFPHRFITRISFSTAESNTESNFTFWNPYCNKTCWRFQSWIFRFRRKTAGSQKGWRYLHPLCIADSRRMGTPRKHNPTAEGNSVAPRRERTS